MQLTYMKKVKLTNCLWAMLLGVAMCLSAVSCEKNELTDGDKFALYYPGITDIGPSTNMDLNPTYHGAKASDFKIYQVTLDGAPYQTESFLIDAQTGQVQLRNTDNLPVGKYSLSISCVSGGQLYQFPDLISVNMMRPVPEGIVVEPSRIELTLAQVTNLNSLEMLPGAQITTEGEHISIENYFISAVRRDGVLVEDWTELFAVDQTGEFSVLKNINFTAGVYSIDFKLTTMVVGKDSEDGVFADALVVDVVSPPISLEYSPKVAKVEYLAGYVSSAPALTGSANGLEYSIKSVIPEGLPVTIDASKGIITLADNHGLQPGASVAVSVRVKNNYGTKDFDQVFQMSIVEFINPITKLAYNDSTVWQNTKFELSPVEVDGDEKVFSFVELPESLAALSIDEQTGKISAKKGNGMPLGDYIVKVKVENPKGNVVEEIKFNVIENPYYFTYVRWGNNLGLVPEENYASQHRVSTTESYTFGVTATDIKPGTEVKFAINEGSKTSCATIDEATGEITTNPDYAAGKVDELRAHFVFVKVTTGEGTPGETSMKIPVFLDFKCPHGDYIVTYTPFAFQCNPKTGGTSAVPQITKADGSALTDDERAKITMDFRRSFNYWNLGGPESHVSGAMDKVSGGFLQKVCDVFYASIDKGSNYKSRDPFSYYGRPDNMTNKFAYINAGTLSLYIAPEKWKIDGEYADGIFTGQITMLNTGSDPVDAASPYRIFPLFVWFDTEF